MPTLRSVGVHAQLCTKLAASDGENNGNTGVNPPITTPLALLSRDAATTAQQLQVPLSLWQEVRLAVADALLIHSCSTTARIQQGQQLNSSPTVATDSAGAGSCGVTVDGQVMEDQEISKEIATPSGSLIVGSMTALEYWSHAQSLQRSPITTGCNILDLWLSSKHVTQFTGPHSSGKTQLCLSIALHHASAQDQQNKVFYLTSTTPSPVLARRLRQLVASSKLPLYILDHIELISLSTPYHLLAVLQRVKESMTEVTATSTPAVASPSTRAVLLILDSASGCLQGSRWDMTQQITLQLKQLLKLHGVSIVMTNGISSNGDAALGPTWNNEAPGIRIRLQAAHPIQDDEQDEPEHRIIQATLEKHPDKVVRASTVAFCVTAQGVQHVEDQA